MPYPFEPLCSLPYSMETGESILDAIFDEDSVEDVQEVEMMYVEEGELVEQDSQSDLGQNIGRDCRAEKQESCENCLLGLFGSYNVLISVCGGCILALLP
ncbi:hypothetical protein RHGRI_007458 [Rhododendron griersonianum]|uniref:Uncharacterized protein n=1 Tax=Rhododendron griersonianum TaxID=479676 RepID=A0AAV6KY57_9ERIC|nr:hypothetical protein RHGRI_007458 [Rhododendron griersonianum]